MYSVYILRCADGTLYTGIARDLEKRLDEHNNRASGAKYTKPRRPVRIVYSQTYPDRSAALKAEAAIKKMPRAQKLSLIGEAA